MQSFNVYTTLYFMYITNINFFVFVLRDMWFLLLFCLERLFFGMAIDFAYTFTFTHNKIDKIQNMSFVKISYSRIVAFCYFDFKASTYEIAVFVYEVIVPLEVLS